MRSLDMSTNIQTCLEIIVNIWSGPGRSAGMCNPFVYTNELTNQSKLSLSDLVYRTNLT